MTKTKKIHFDLSSSDDLRSNNLFLDSVSSLKY